MLLINAVTTIIAVLVASVILWLQTVFIFQPYALIILCGVGLWLILSLSDIAQIKLIEMFNKEAR